jgi:hypothetical protein
MEKITEYAPFVDAEGLRNKLTEKLNALTSELASLRSQLVGDTTDQSADLGTIEKATILSNGGSLPDTRAGVFVKARDKELETRELAEAVARVLRDLPERIERMRIQAARERRKELAPEFKKINAAFADATSRMLAAIDAEDVLRQRMVMGGFGFQEALFTNADWLNREHLLNIRNSL